MGVDEMGSRRSGMTPHGLMINYTPTAIVLARYVTHMNTQSPGGICNASLEVGWYSINTF